MVHGPRRLHRRWWLWAGVSAAVAVTAVGLGLGLGLRPSIETLRFDL